MAKKSKRSYSQQASTATNSAAAVSNVRTPDKEFNPDYSYVIKDLKRIGILAGVFFSVLAVLAIFLR